MQIDLPKAIALVIGVYGITRLLQMFLRRRDGEDDEKDPGRPDDTGDETPGTDPDQDQED